MRWSNRMKQDRFFSSKSLTIPMSVIRHRGDHQNRKVLVFNPQIYCFDSENAQHTTLKMAWHGNARGIWCLCKLASISIWRRSCFFWASSLWMIIIFRCANNHLVGRPHKTTLGCFVLVPSFASSCWLFGFQIIAESATITSFFAAWSAQLKLKLKLLLNYIALDAWNGRNSHESCHRSH